MATKNPDYMTAKETAEAWGVTRRYVNLCIEDGRIPGVMKIGNMWMIPKNTRKPVGKREGKTPENPLSSDLAHVLRSVPTSVPRNNPDSVMETVSEERFGQILKATFAYARGDYERTISCFHKLEGDDAAKLCACPVTIAAAVSTGNYPLFTEIEAYLKELVRANISDDVTACAEQSLASGYLGALAPAMVPDWLKNGDFAVLPPEAKPDALYKRAYYFYCIGKYESMLAVAQTALAVYDSGQDISLTRLYLRLMCALALYALEQIDEARRYLLCAMRIYLPVGFTTPFAELVLNFCGLMEQCLEKEFPAHYNAVTAQWKHVVPNWQAFHNRFTKDNITSILSRRDYEMAILAAQGLPYAEIAKQFNVSVGRLSNIMREIYEKLFINGKKELADFVVISSQKT